jgi:hypothetical protein
MPYQKPRVSRISNMKKAIAPEGKNFSSFCGDFIIVDFYFNAKLKAGANGGYDAGQFKS